MKYNQILLQSSLENDLELVSYFIIDETCKIQ